MCSDLICSRSSSDTLDEACVAGGNGPSLSRKWTVNKRAWLHLPSGPCCVQPVTFPLLRCCDAKLDMGVTRTDVAFPSLRLQSLLAAFLEHTHTLTSKLRSACLVHHVCSDRTLTHTFMLQPPQTGRLLSNIISTSHRIIHSWLLSRTFVSTATGLGRCVGTAVVQTISILKAPQLQGKNKFTRNEQTFPRCQTKLLLSAPQID